MEDPVVPLERNLYGHPPAGLLWERLLEKVLLKHGWEKVPNWECLIVHREKGLFLSVYVDDMKLAGKKHNIDPLWKLLNKEVPNWACLLVHRENGLFLSVNVDDLKLAGKKQNINPTCKFS